MPRPKTFCCEKALQDAMLVFWAKGYEATSLTDLTKAMGLSKSSFYETFGCKRDLYLKALSCYIAKGEQYLSQFFQEQSFADGMRQMFGQMMEKAVACDAQQGCFMVNAASELANSDPMIKAKIKEGFEGMVSVYQRFLERDIADGCVRADLDAACAARFFVNQSAGLCVYSQANASADEIADLLEMSLRVLD